MAKIELYVIEKVKKMRIRRGIIQAPLAKALVHSGGFIVHIENLKRRDKYNIKHLNETAKLLNVRSWDFFRRSRFNSL